VSGIFDRVHLTRAADGRCISAWIIDFKTDEIAHEEALAGKLAGYAPQIALYREALEKLTGLKAASIRCSLLFTRLERLVDL
jgi:ATP-dependent exoDNAse (exonuclease V) beta subunit